MKFKNLRRPTRAHKAGIDVSPPVKKQKRDEAVKPATPSASDVAEYEQHIGHMKKAYSSKKWSLANMITLLELTAGLRRQWILEECPTVREVLDKFPCLAEPKLVSSQLVVIVQYSVI